MTRFIKINGTHKGVFVVMCEIATTRFNNETYMENVKWREKNSWDGCIYGAPKQISDMFTPKIYIFILEMNNDTNKIKGVGLIKNRIVINKTNDINHNKYYKLYSQRNYNRYIYKSKYRIDRKEMTHDEKKVLRIFDMLVFKGKTHLKRGQGIIVVPEWIKNNNIINFIKLLKKMFHERYKLFN